MRFPLFQAGARIVSQSPMPKIRTGDAPAYHDRGARPNLIARVTGGRRSEHEVGGVERKRHRDDVEVGAAVAVDVAVDMGLAAWKLHKACDDVVCVDMEGLPPTV